MSQATSESTLRDFLSKHRSWPRKGDTYSHTSMVPRGSYKIPDEKLEYFYQLYTEDCFTEGNELRLTEAQAEYTPVKIDIDFRFKTDTLTRHYTQQHIQAIVALYTKVIEEYYDTTGKVSECFVTEKSSDAVAWQTKPGDIVGEADNTLGIAKDGIHLMFPYLITKTKYQLLFRDSVLKEIDPILADLNLYNSMADVLDLAVIDRNNWMMYGSRKVASEPYLLTHIYQAFGDEVSELPIDGHSPADLVRLLSLRAKTVCPVTAEMLQEGGDDDSTDLADIFRTEAQMKESMLAQLEEELKEIKIVARSRKAPKARNKKSKKSKLKPHELTIVRMLVKALDASRASNRNSWIEVGWALHNIHNVDDSLLEDWTQFSQRDPRYAMSAPAECTEEWHNMYDEGGLGIGSLRWWVSQDNPEEYTKILNCEARDSILKSINKEISVGNDKLNKALSSMKVQPYDIAQVLHTMYGNDFVCVSNRGKFGEFYHFNDHRWRLSAGDVLLRSKVSEDVPKAYFNMISDIVNRSIEGDGECQDILEGITDCKESLDKFKKTVENIQGTSFKNNVMTEAVELFIDKTERFTSKLDENHHLIGFDNGVYDFHKSEFRNGRPEDNVSMSTGIDYPVELDKYKTVEEAMQDMDNNCVGDVMEFVSQVLTDESVRDYVLTLMASFLNGANRNEKFHIWTGCGANGKSKIIELYQLAIGDYAVNLPITLLTRQRSGSSDASPEVARTKGKRFAVLQEPDQKTTLNVGLMKELTGGDRIQARALYQNPIEFKPQFKMILICNHLPKLPHDDEATWRRVRSVEFTSQFMLPDRVDENNPNHFPRDEELADKFDDWKEPFFWILTKYYDIWRKQGLREPAKVVEFTENYRVRMDQFRDFTEEHIIESEDKEQCLTISEIFSRYMDWHAQDGGDTKRLTRQELKEYLEKKMGSSRNYGQKKQGWSGYQLKPLYDVEDSDDEVGEYEQVTADNIDSGVN